MDARLDILTNEMSQVTTCVGRITWRQARLGGFVASPSPSPKASEDEDASSSSDEEMTTSQWLNLCHSWQKGEVILCLKVVMYLGGELV